MAIIEVPDISIVKTVNGSKQLLSLRDQKIKKDGVLNTFGVGSGIKCNGDLYVLESEEEPILEFVLDKGNEITMGIIHEGDVNVDYGDGIKVKNIFKHTYTDGKTEHRIKLYGSVDTITKFHIIDYQFGFIDISRSVKLSSLIAKGKIPYESNLQNIDLSNNVDITYLELFCCKLKSIDLTNLKKLTHLDLRINNYITSLDLSQNTALTYLDIYNLGSLHSLDLSKNTELEYLSFDPMNFTSFMGEFLIDLSKLSKLKEISAHSYGRESEIEYVSFANTLPDRTGKDTGTLDVRDDAAAWIQDICTAKNWTIL